MHQNFSDISFKRFRPAIGLASKGLYFLGITFNCTCKPSLFLDRGKTCKAPDGGRGGGGGEGGEGGKREGRG